MRERPYTLRARRGINPNLDLLNMSDDEIDGKTNFSGANELNGSRQKEVTEKRINVRRPDESGPKIQAPVYNQ